RPSALLATVGSLSDVAPADEPSESQPLHPAPGVSQICHSVAKLPMANTSRRPSVFRPTLGRARFTPAGAPSEHHPPQLQLGAVCQMCHSDPVLMSPTRTNASRRPSVLEPTPGNPRY